MQERQNMKKTCLIIGRVLLKVNLVSEAALKEVSNVVVIRPPGTNKMKLYIKADKENSER